MTDKNVNASNEFGYVILTDNELMNTTGGSVTLTVGGGIGLALAGAGAGLGYYFGRKR